MPIKLEEAEGVWKVDLPYLYGVINKNFEKLFGVEGFEKNLFSNDVINSSNSSNKNMGYYDFYEQRLENNQAPRTKKSYY